jgi:hypothetical protein
MRKKFWKKIIQLKSLAGKKVLFCDPGERETF